MIGRDPTDEELRTIGSAVLRSMRSEDWDVHAYNGRDISSNQFEPHWAIKSDLHVTKDIFRLLQELCGR